MSVPTEKQSAEASGKCLLGRVNIQGVYRSACLVRSDVKQLMARRSFPHYWLEMLLMRFRPL